MAAITWICWILGSLFLGLGGLWFARAVFWDRSRGRRRCPKCWYDMAGVPGLRCPECGRGFVAERVFGKTRRHWRQAVAALVVVLLGYLGVRIPDVFTDGLATVVPTLPLRVVVSMFDGYSEDPSLPAPGIVYSPSFGIAGSPILVAPPGPLTRPAPKTWWERTAWDWEKLQRASRARKRIRKAMRLAKTEPEIRLARSGLYSAEIDLVRLGVESKIALGAVRDLVNHDELPVEMQAVGIEMLIDMGDDVQGAKRTLRRVMRSDRHHVTLRLAALEGVVVLGDDPSVYRSTFRELLGRVDWWERPFKRTSVKAAQIAKQMPTAVAIAEITDAFQAGDCVTRSAIRHTYRTLYSTSPITNAMSDFLNREYAASTRSAIEALVHSDQAVRLIAARELLCLPPVGFEEAERCLSALEQTSHPVEQRYLIDVIRIHHISGDRAAHLLRGRVGNDEAIDLGYAALLAADKTCPDKVVIEIAIEALNDPYPHARYLAAWVLGRRGVVAALALSALERARNDEYGSVQEAVTEAIEAIEDAVLEERGQSLVQPDAIGGP